jgi:hypothetical protein
MRLTLPQDDLTAAVSTLVFSASNSSASPQVQFLHALRLAGAAPVSVVHAAAKCTNQKFTIYHTAIKTDFQWSQTETGPIVHKNN